MADPQQPSFDEHDTLPPSFDPALGVGIEEPPTKLGGILKRLGPGLIIAGSIVGSGELIATTKTGAQAGIVLLWLIIVGCVIKVFVQIELGRYTIGHGETTLAALDQVPGPRLRVGWIVWFWLAMMLIGIGQLGGIVGGVGQAAALAIPINGDYAEATQYPSASEIKTYLKWDDAILSEWDIAQYNPIVTPWALSLPTDSPISAEYWEKYSKNRAGWLLSWVAQFDKPLHARLVELSVEIRSDSEAERTKAAEELPGLLEKANEGLLKSAAAGEITVGKGDGKELKQFAGAVKSLRELADMDESRRKRILRGHQLLSRRLRELDRLDDSRAIRAIAAVAELDRRKAWVKTLKEKFPDDLDIRIAQVQVENQEKVIATILNPHTWDDKIWAALVALITAALLFRGRYLLVQNVSTVLVVGFTFITIGNVISLQMTEAWHISASQFLQGLTFQLPEASDGVTPLATALATFGIIGVGASELIAYPYWCLEKGYAKFAGQRSPDENWGRRARGWMKVMRYDAFTSMIIYTLATLAFFMMGVAVLYNEGRDPDGMRMVSTLARAYVPVFGEYARWLFLAGAVAVLYSTFLVATAGNARMYTDSLKIYGLMDPHNEKAHDRALSFFSVLLPFLCLAVFCSGANPVRMILLSGAMQALLLPMIGFGALYFRFTRTDKRIKPGPIWDILLIVSFIGLFIAGTYGAYKQIIKFF